ncbi:ABC transporter ATP-binding protein [Spiroplasma sp. DGKH1]|uniref:ABC transporter ATP-binding protein n=1 Tax=Spiroplasma sp. DGKH1 TaxID=3050074 RepID=UPI0034C5E5F2
MENIIIVNKFTKKLQNFKIENISFKVKKGSLHALIGESGSGKSVMLKSIIGALTRYRGIIKVNGYAPKKYQSKLKMGYATNLEEFPLGITGYNFLKLVGNLTPLKKKTLVNNIDNLLKMFNLYQHKDKVISSYSSGMKNRLMLIHSLMNDPDLIILDEPGANLDYPSRVNFYRILMKYKKEGKTVLLTTHMIDEIEPLIDDCTILLNGKMLYSGSYAPFKAKMNYRLRSDNNLKVIEYLKIRNIPYRFVKKFNELIITISYPINMDQIFKYTLQNNVHIYYFKEMKNDISQLRLKLGELQKTNDQLVSQKGGENNGTRT